MLNEMAGPPRLERGTSVLETDVLPLKLQAHLNKATITKKTFF
jgi:hypothetical protein